MFYVLIFLSVCLLILFSGTLDSLFQCPAISICSLLLPKALSLSPGSHRDAWLSLRPPYSTKSSLGEVTQILRSESKVPICHLSLLLLLPRHSSLSHFQCPLFRLTTSPCAILSPAIVLHPELGTWPSVPLSIPLYIFTVQVGGISYFPDSCLPSSLEAHVHDHAVGVDITRDYSCCN